MGIPMQQDLNKPCMHHIHLSPTSPQNPGLSALGIEIIPLFNKPCTGRLLNGLWPLLSTST